MQKLQRCGISIFLILTLLLSGISDIHVYADESSPTQETSEVQETEVSPQETQEEGTTTLTEESSEPTTESTEISEKTAEPTSAPTDAPDSTDDQYTAEPTDVQETETTPTSEETTPIPEETEFPTTIPTSLTETTEAVVEEEEPETLPELLESVPEGTDVVILNEEGEVEPLASEEAAEIFVEGDPIWCMDGYAPDPSDTTHCTPSYTSFSALITELSTGAYTGNGTIWVAWNYNATEDNDTILFYGDDPNLSGIVNNSLTIQGGWSGTAGDTSYNTLTPSTIDVALVIDYWKGDVALSNIFINNTTDNDAGVGLYIDTDGNVTLSNVEVSGTTGTVDTLDGDGAVIGASGNIQITDSTFNNNDGYGLDVSSAGSIEVSNITASDNNSAGVYLDSYISNLGSGSVTVTGNNIFNGNGIIDGGPGLYIDSYASTTINNVTAYDNGMMGIFISSGEDYAKHIVDIQDVTVYNNFFGLVVEQYADGDVTISNLVSRDNAVGSEIYAMDGDVNISSSIFTANLDTGLYLETYGDINLNQVTAGSYMGSAGNGIIGLEIYSPDGKISITASDFSDNGQAGLAIYNQKSLTLIDVTADNNPDVNLHVDATDPPKTCYCPNSSFTMEVIGGTYSNSDIGMELYTYQSDQLVLGTGVNAPYFENNTTNIFHDETIIPECDNCYCNKPEEQEGKPYKIIDVPDGGSGNVPQECSIYAGTILQLADGSYVQVACPFDGFSSLKNISESELPGSLESGDVLDIGILLGLLGEDGTYVINSDGTITITFTIPAEKRDHKHRILFWDTTMNGSQGGWYEMPEHHFGGTIALHPDDPQDPRRIFRGVQQSRDTITVTVNFAGYFLLVSE